MVSSSPDFSRPIGKSSRTSLRNSNSTYPQLDSTSFHNSNNSHYFNYYWRRSHSLQCTLEMAPQNTCSSPSETWISSLIPPSHFPSSALYSTSSTALQYVSLLLTFPLSPSSELTSFLAHPSPSVLMASLHHLPLLHSHLHTATRVNFPKLKSDPITPLL